MEEDQRLLIERAIERLYYSDSIRIGNCIYPQFRIRLNLKQLDFLIIQDTLERLTSNQNKVRNSGAYVTTVLFNTILESASDLAVDPYLNQMRQASRHRAVESRQEVALL